MNKRIALLCDTHFGLRGNAPYFVEKQRQFFQEVFFPYIDKEGIDTIIHLGDVFDKRSTINFVLLDKSKKFFFDEIEKRNLRVIYIIGNHDTYYRNTNFPNSVRLLLEDSKYRKYEIYDSPSEVIVDGQLLCLIPWVNVENQEETKKLIETTKAKYLFGHLEIKGFQMLKGIKSESGFERKYLSNFDMVFSGHFHHRSEEDNIYYLGNPYETTWADYGNQKGFHTFDVKTGDLALIKNPYNSHIEVSDASDVTDEKVGGMIVKVNLKGLDETQINKIYTAFDMLNVKPEDVVFITNPAINKTSEYKVEDLETKSTKELLMEYVDGSIPENIDADKLKKYLNLLHEKGEEA